MATTARYLDKVYIEPVCKTYENQHEKVPIGDRGGSAFLGNRSDKRSRCKIAIDDGRPHGEIAKVTLEETLPYLRPCGVFICEAIHGMMNELPHDESGLALSLNADRNPRK